MRKAPASPDVLVAGAGAWGLAAGLLCARAGLSVLVVDAAAPGAGASGGLVGALAPHAPHPWSARKAAQAVALAAAPAFWAAVAAEGGLDPGYAATGRALPLRDPAARARAEAAGAAAARHWPARERPSPADGARAPEAPTWPGTRGDPAAPATPPDLAAPAAASSHAAPASASAHAAREAPRGGAAPLDLARPDTLRDPAAASGLGAARLLPSSDPTLGQGGPGDPRPTWEVVAADALPGWLDPAAAPAGLVRETLSARLVPRAAVAALAAALRARGGVIRRGWPVTAVEDGALRSGAERIAAGLVVLAAGAGTARLAPGLPLAAVKGQAALLAAAAPPGAPILHADDLWIVPRPDGVAVGATAEPAWEAPHTTDARLDALLARARALCPALAAAPVAERWAGLRPRGARPDPLLNRLPGCERTLVATGGFRTGLATAPQAAALVAAFAAGETPTLPPGWSLADHRATATRAR